MTKQELQAKVADRAGMTKVDAAKAVDAVAESITAALKKGEKVTWTGFGTFEVRPRRQRMGRNPQTGAPVWGFLPILCLLGLTSKVPKPVQVTFSPFFNAAVIDSATASTALAASTFVIPALSATLACNSC